MSSRANPVVAVVCQPFLSSEECDALIAVALVAEESARVAVGESDTRAIRRARLQAVGHPELLGRIESEILGYNDELYGFELSGLSEADPPAFVRYAAGDHFDWHVDNGLAEGPSATRKLSFSLQLSDPSTYDGGNLELAMYAPTFYGAVAEAQTRQTRERGALVVFPSFHVHRVSPIVRGERAALVGWLHGPPFR